MKKILFLLLVALAMNISFASQCYCWTEGNPSSYKITVQKLEAKNSGGTWVNVFTLNMEIDIADAAQNSSAAQISGFLPEGDYVNFRIFVSETIKYTGSIGSNYTLTDGSITFRSLIENGASTRNWPATLQELITDGYVGIAEDNGTWSDTSAGECTAVLDLGWEGGTGGDTDNYFTVTSANDLTTPITVNWDSEISISYYFDTQGTLIHQTGATEYMFFLPPKEGTKFEITVDGTTFTIDKSNMAVDF